MGFLNLHDGLFLLSSGGLGTLFLGLLCEREETLGTTLPPLIHGILNLRYDSGLEEEYTLELRGSAERGGERDAERRGM